MSLLVMDSSIVSTYRRSSLLDHGFILVVLCTTLAESIILRVCSEVTGIDHRRREAIAVIVFIFLLLLLHPVYLSNVQHLLLHHPLLLALTQDAVLAYLKLARAIGRHDPHTSGTKSSVPTASSPATSAKILCVGVRFLALLSVITCSEVCGRLAACIVVDIIHI